MATDPHAICRKWVKRLGIGFHPDTRGKDYSPRLPITEAREYDADMTALFAACANGGDAYECGVMALADAGLIPADPDFHQMDAEALNAWYERAVGYRPQVDDPTMTTDELRSLCTSYHAAAFFEDRA